MGFLRAKTSHHCHILNSFIEIKLTHHTSHPFEVDNSMVFRTFTELYVHRQSQFYHIFMTFSCYPSVLHPCLALGNTDALPVSTDFPVLDTSHKWDHRICGLP